MHTASPEIGLKFSIALIIRQILSDVPIHPLQLTYKRVPRNFVRSKWLKHPLSDNVAQKVIALKRQDVESTIDLTTKSRLVVADLWLLRWEPEGNLPEPGGSPPKPKANSLILDAIRNISIGKLHASELASEGNASK
ncbi:hypothetical protein FNV43_RR07375 [Rhamnella rubrinervis]|uniref:Uncharacterized protein n=1 Tax=Rhamnella rubrinervis TaxID=2594499 RepID=A0A8K0MMW8_9ROSA|nr:hypothetical protein FNV43_RR07375 [Rhamnella rubrinervis]